MQARQDLRNGGRGRRGNALVEFALSFALVTPVLLGSIQFGYAFYAYNKLENGVRAGARYASLRTYDSVTSTPSAAFLNAVRNVTIFGDPAGGTVPITPGLAVSNVELVVTMAGNRPDWVTVRIVNFRMDAIVSSFNWNGKPEAAFLYTGRLQPPT